MTDTGFCSVALTHLNTVDRLLFAFGFVLLPIVKLLCIVASEKNQACSYPHTTHRSLIRTYTSNITRNLLSICSNFQLRAENSSCASMQTNSCMSVQNLACTPCTTLLALLASMTLFFAITIKLVLILPVSTFWDKQRSIFIILDLQ